MLFVCGVFRLTFRRRPRRRSPHTFPPKCFHPRQKCHAVVVAAIAAAAGGIFVHDFEIRPENFHSGKQF